MMKRILSRILIIAVVILSVLAGAFFIYASVYYHADAEAADIPWEAPS